MVLVRAGGTSAVPGKSSLHAPDLLARAVEVPGALHDRLQKPFSVLRREQQRAAAVVADFQSVERQRRGGGEAARRVDRLDTLDRDPPAEQPRARDHLAVADLVAGGVV